jgi:hypothetical protein
MDVSSEPKRFWMSSPSGVRVVAATLAFDTSKPM